MYNFSQNSSNTLNNQNNSANPLNDGNLFREPNHPVCANICQPNTWLSPFEQTPTLTVSSNATPVADDLSTPVVHNLPTTVQQNMSDFMIAENLTQAVSYGGELFYDLNSNSAGSLHQVSQYALDNFNEEIAKLTQYYHISESAANDNQYYDGNLFPWSDPLLALTSENQLRLNNSNSEVPAMSSQKTAFPVLQTFLQQHKSDGGEGCASFPTNYMTYGDSNSLLNNENMNLCFSDQNTTPDNWISILSEYWYLLQLIDNNDTTMILPTQPILHTDKQQQEPSDDIANLNLHYPANKNDTPQKYTIPPSPIMHEIEKTKSKNSKRVCCPLCSMYITQKNLSAHKAAVHSKNKDRFPCPYPNCNKSYSRKNDLEDRHISPFHKGLKHKCGVCSRSFGRKDKLTKHMNESH